MKVLRREVVYSKVDNSPELEILVRLPIQIGEDQADDASYYYALGKKYEAMLTQELESIVAARNGVSPMTYEGMEELEELIEDHNITRSFQDWKAAMVSIPTENVFGVTNELVFEGLEDVGVFMLSPTGVMGGEKFVAKSIITERFSDINLFKAIHRVTKSIGDKKKKISDKYSINGVLK